MSGGHNHRVTPVTISYTEQLSSGTYLIGFKRSFDFVAGQVIGIALEESGARRLYSICSGEKEGEVRILYKVIDSGYLTPQLSDLGTGDTIWITEPRGEFFTDPDAAVWIATGTGIAPYYAMLRSGLGKNKQLIHGCRYLEEFHFFDEFSEELDNNYIRCCSGESSDDAFFGRVTAFLEKQEELDPSIKYYLCGSAEMVVEARDILIRKGVPFDQIISEIYF